MRQNYKGLRLVAHILMQILIITCIQLTPVFADETGINTGDGEDVNIGGGEGSGEGTEHMNTGYHQSDGGYRCYMEDKAGKIRQTVEPIVCLLPTKLYLFQITISVQGIVIFYLSQVVLSV